jgi:carbonic anhydrase
MELFSDEIMADLLDDELATASLEGKNGRTRITRADTLRATSSSGTRSRTRRRASRGTCGVSASPLVPHKVPIYGYVYDVKTGRLNEVKTATEANKAAAP